MKAFKITNKIISKSIKINCPLDIAWWKWTTHEGLITFFGADNKIELKINGAFEIYFLINNPDGEKGSEGCKILSFLPNKMLSFSWNAPPKFPEIRNNSYQTWVVVTFNEIGKDITELTLSHTGWPEGNDWEEVYNYFYKAWDNVLQELAKSCK